MTLPAEDNHPPESFPAAFIRVNQNVGRVRGLIDNMLDDQIWEYTGRHNPYFHSEHLEEAERLDELRLKLSFIHEHLYEILEILHPDS
jgi:hypothetical protein